MQKMTQLGKNLDEFFQGHAVCSTGHDLTEGYPHFAEEKAERHRERELSEHMPCPQLVREKAETETQSQLIKSTIARVSICPDRSDVILRLLVNQCLHSTSALCTRGRSAE